MIKIENSNLEQIASDYFVDIKSSIIERCDYYLMVFDVLNKQINSNTLKNNLLHGSTKKSLTNIFLKTKLTDQKKYNTVEFVNCHAWVITNINTLENIAKYLQDEQKLKKLILCKPNESVQIENDIKAVVGLNNLNLDNNVKSFINNIISYSLFDSYSYRIANSLGINTCPYCNRNYINTVIDINGKGIIRPTFDHFFPQVLHPFLSLSFFNLIPSCYFCNSSVKGANPMHITTHLHPYMDGFDNDAIFNIVIKGCKPNKSDPQNYSLSFMNKINSIQLNSKYRKIFGGTPAVPNSDEGNINLFKLSEIYQSHLDIVGEIVVKCDRLGLGYSNSLNNWFDLLNTNKSEFYQYYFGNYFNEKDFHRRPMAKLSKDVVSQVIPSFVKKSSEF